MSAIAADVIDREPEQWTPRAHCSSQTPPKIWAETSRIDSADNENKDFTGTQNILLPAAYANHFLLDGFPAAVCRCAARCPTIRSRRSSGKLASKCRCPNFNGYLTARTAEEFWSSTRLSPQLFSEGYE
ncbi:MAG: hypothetical protein ACLGSH_10330 [Acidobacteriota bacterium]